MLSDQSNFLFANVKLSGNGKDWKSIKIDFDSDENAIFMNTDKKGEKVISIFVLSLPAWHNCSYF